MLNIYKIPLVSNPFFYLSWYIFSMPYSLWRVCTVNVSFTINSFFNSCSPKAVSRIFYIETQTFVRFIYQYFTFDIFYQSISSESETLWRDRFLWKKSLSDWLLSPSWCSEQQWSTLREEIALGLRPRLVLSPTSNSTVYRLFKAKNYRN